MTVETAPRLYSVEEYLELELDNDKRYELVEGEIVEMPGPSIEHGQIVSRLRYHIVSQKGVDYVDSLINELAFVLGPRNAPEPDLAYIAPERLAGVDRQDAFKGAPDLAIEVVSRTDIWADIAGKVNRYLTAGSRRVWVIDPFTSSITVFYPDRPQKLLTQLDELDGEDVIPGFKLPVKALFE